MCQANFTNSILKMHIDHEDYRNNSAFYDHQDDSQNSIILQSTGLWNK